MIRPTEHSLDAPADGYPSWWHDGDTVELPLDCVRRLVTQAIHGPCTCRLCQLALDEAARYAWQPGEKVTVEGGHGR